MFILSVFLKSKQQKKPERRAFDEIFETKILESHVNG
jgi:hypothetical protein